MTGNEFTHISHAVTYQ